MKTNAPEQELLQQIGMLIAVKRHERGDLTTATASATGISQSTLSEIENGHCNSLKVTTLTRLMRHFKIAWSDLPLPII